MLEKLLSISKAIPLSAVISGLLPLLLLIPSVGLGQGSSNDTRLPSLNPDTATYTGTIRVFLAEPSSRWYIGGDTYRNGFLDFPLVDSLEIAPFGSWSGTAVWDASATMFESIDSGNIMSAAVVFNSEGVITDINPPYQYYLFTAHYVDASATATIGQPGVETHMGDYTHQVFVEVSGTRGT